jgi:hypothetical protein
MDLQDPYSRALPDIDPEAMFESASRLSGPTSTPLKDGLDLNV